MTLSNSHGDRNFRDDGAIIGGMFKWPSRYSSGYPKQTYKIIQS